MCSKHEFVDVIERVGGQSRYRGKIKVRRVSNRTIACHETKVPVSGYLQDKRGHWYGLSDYPLSPTGESYLYII